MCAMFLMIQNISYSGCSLEFYEIQYVYIIKSHLSYKQD